MKKYKIVKKIILDFLTPQDQYSRWCTEGFVEYNGTNTVWYINPSGEKEETINTGDLIELYIQRGILVEVKEN